MLEINSISIMELQILISKKGTKVVTASNLYQVLGLPNQQYATNLKRWMNEVYEFRDGIRKPLRMKDFAKRPVKDALLEDYYFSVELAKLITLNSKSKVKQKYAKWLLSMENKVENAELLTMEQVVGVLELAKIMGLVSCQTAAEQNHLKTYEKRKKGNANKWWQFRASLLGYSVDKLQEKAGQMGKSFKGKTQRQLLMEVDKYEMVRTAVVDLFMALGKTERYAKNLGKLAKVFARELKVDIFDDRNAAPIFQPQLNGELVNEVKGLKKGGFLKLWQT